MTMPGIEYTKKSIEICQRLTLTAFGTLLLVFSATFRLDILCSDPPAGVKPPGCSGLPIFGWSVDLVVAGYVASVVLLVVLCTFGYATWWNMLKLKNIEKQAEES